MRLACSSYSYHDDLDGGEMDVFEFLERAETDLPVDGVELIEEHLPDDDPETLSAVRETADSYDLDIACLSVFYNDFAKAARTDRREDVRTVTSWLDRADALGANVVRAFTGFPGLHDREHGDPAVWRDVARCLQECVDYAETCETTLAIENHNHDGLIRTADDVYEVRSRVNGELGLVLDLANYVDGRESIERTRHLADHVHAAYEAVDDRGADPDHPYYAEELRALVDTGYEGYVTLEWEGEADDRAAVPRALAYLDDCLPA